MTLEEIKEMILSENINNWSDPKKLTMIPRKTLNNIEYCIRECVAKNIEGDYIECGIWRGGSVIYANEIFKSLNQNRKIYAADSFRGLPEPNPSVYPKDKGDTHFKLKELSVSLEDVKKNFRIFGEITDNIIFLEGWFRDTLPKCDSEKFCIIRADGDMYESTINILENLYPKLAIGGFFIVDDYGHQNCRAAVEDYRKNNNIEDEMILIDSEKNAYPSIYWIKTK
jgi:hypothetical protein